MRAIKAMPVFPRTALLGLLVLLVLAGPGLASAGEGDEPSTEESGHEPSEAETLTREEALKADAARIAESQGWNEDEAVARLERQQAFDELLGELRAEYPDAYVSAWTERDVDGKGHVRFAGEVPEGAREAAERRGLAVEFHGDATHSRAEQQERLARVMEEASELGWGTAIAAYSARDQQLTVTLERPDDDRTDEELRAQLPDELRAPDVDVSFTDGPVAGH